MSERMRTYTLLLLRLTPVYVLPERKPPSFYQVVRISFVGEGFALKANIAVSRVMTGVLKPADKVFHDVPDVKRQDAQFGLLTQVNPFVVQQGRAGVGASDQNERKQGHTVGAELGKVDNVPVFGHGKTGKSDAVLLKFWGICRTKNGWLRFNKL